VDLVVIDFESFYSREFSLSKLTTEEYIRDPQFEVIGVCAKHTDEPVEWVSGTHEEIQRYLDSLQLQDKAVLAHNMMFDGAILSWRFGIRPKLLLDTLSMSRAWHGVDQRHSLAALAKQYGLPDKGTEVQNAMGLRREDFSPEQLADYGEYCKHDVDLCLALFQSMVEQGFPKRELQLIDKTLRMFTEPTLELDLELLEGHLIATQRRKQELLDAAGITDKKDLMSNKKFADLLERLGIDPPMKVSPTTGKLTYAFAKTDPAMKELEEHESPHVQALVAARLGNKSTLEETRTERFMSIAGRGSLPIPLRYYAAHTGRWGGSDKINLQNLPSRGANAKKLKRAILAPEGHMLIDCDSSQIEARVLAWLAGQDDLVAAFANGDDVYIQMAAKIYGVAEGDVTKEQRFVGKTTILGAGYGMGGPKFAAQLKNFGHEIDEDEARRIIDIYRYANSAISGLWKQAQQAIKGMVHGDKYAVGIPGVVEVDPAVPGIVLPSGLTIGYRGLAAEQGARGYEYTYQTRNGPSRIYGGKVVENVVQALARCVVAEQLIKIAKRYRVVLTVHDSIVSCVPEDEVDEAREYIEQCMRTPPKWAAGLPVNCESEVGKSYGG